jgi:RNA polymerase sigma-70 factor (ECF subfamily)
VRNTGGDSDDELMRRVALGDDDAFRHLVERNINPVLALAARMLGDPSEAEDIAQEAMLKLWNGAGKWRSAEAMVSTWLYRVTSNLCIDRMRKRRALPLGNEEEIHDDPAQLRAIEESEIVTSVNSALQKLPDRQRLALVLCHYQGMKMREAANIMEVSETAVESLLGRARRALKKELLADRKELLA